MAGFTTWAEPCLAPPSHARPRPACRASPCRAEPGRATPGRVQLASFSLPGVSAAWVDVQGLTRGRGGCLQKLAQAVVAGAGRVTAVRAAQVQGGSMPAR